MNRPRVILADDQILLLDAIKNLLQTEFDVVGTFANGRALVEGAAALAPDVIVLDISMPEMDGLMAGPRLKRLLPKVKLVYLTVNLDPGIAAVAFRWGASAYVGKNSAATELIKAIRLVLHGGSYLTPMVNKDMPRPVTRKCRRNQDANGLTGRQEEVLQLLAEGRSMKEVASELNVIVRTVAYHKYSMMEHLQLRSSAELIKFAVRNSLAATV
jgi:DNA-binding NarL/FixJ family response regulator